MFIRPIVNSDLPAVLEVYRQSEDFLALGPDPRASLEMVEKDQALSRQQGGVFCGIFLEEAPPPNLAGFENPPGLDGQEETRENLTGSDSNLSGSAERENLSGLGSCVGILDYIPGYNRDPGAAFIELLMLARPYRGRGLGKAAVEWLLPALSGEGCQKRLYAAVQTNNPGAIRFWQRLGFRITGPAALQPDGTETYPIEYAASQLDA